MALVDLDETWFQGAASIERVAGGLKPWRLPHTKRHLFSSPGDGLMNRASFTSGVRIRFETNSPTLRLTFLPLAAPIAVMKAGHCFDLVINNMIESVVCGQGGMCEAVFTGLPIALRVVEIWLPPSCEVTITGLEIAEGASARPIPDRRPRWVTWGSSLTHCVRALSASRTWPAIVARRRDLHLVNLGFGGECHIDPMVAMYIRDLPADFISLKLGINTIGGSVNARTYPALVTGAIQIIREKHVHTPIVLASPIGYPPHETKPNAVGYTIEGMRNDAHAVWRRLVEAGDRNLFYVNGLRLFSVEEIGQWAEDQCHPSGEGMEVQAAHWDEHVMPLLLGRA